MKIFRSILPLAIALALYGCNPCQYYARRCALVESRVDSVWSHDTTFIERIVTDTVQIVTLPLERVTNTVISPDTARAETSLAYAWAYLNGQQLMLRLANKPQAPLQVPLVEEHTRHQSHSGKKTTETRRVIEYRTRPIVKFLASVGGIALALFLVQIIIKLCKRFI